MRSARRLPAGWPVARSTSKRGGPGRRAGGPAARRASRPASANASACSIVCLNTRLVQHRHTDLLAIPAFPAGPEPSPLGADMYAALAANAGHPAVAALLGLGS